MSVPRIVCPNCGTPIRLTETMVAHKQVKGSYAVGLSTLNNSSFQTFSLIAKFFRKGALMSVAIRPRLRNLHGLT